MGTWIFDAPEEAVGISGYGEYTGDLCFVAWGRLESATVAEITEFATTLNEPEYPAECGMYASVARTGLRWLREDGGEHELGVPLDTCTPEEATFAAYGRGYGVDGRLKIVRAWRVKA